MISNKCPTQAKSLIERTNAYVLRFPAEAVSDIQQRYDQQKYEDQDRISYKAWALLQLSVNVPLLQAQSWMHLSKQSYCFAMPERAGTTSQDIKLYALGYLKDLSIFCNPRFVLDDAKSLLSINCRADFTFYVNPNMPIIQNGGR